MGRKRRTHQSASCQRIHLVPAPRFFWLAQPLTIFLKPGDLIIGIARHTFNSVAVLKHQKICLFRVRAHTDVPGGRNHQYQLFTLDGIGIVFRQKYVPHFFLFGHLFGVGDTPATLQWMKVPCNQAIQLAALLLGK